MNTKARRCGHVLGVRDVVGEREGVRGNGGAPINEKHAQTGAFLVFSGRKVNEHVRHAHTGMPYVFGGMWGWGWWLREGGGWITRNTPRRGVFLVEK